MAEEKAKSTENNTSGEETKKKKKIPKVFIIIPAVLVVVLIAVTVFLFVLKPNSSKVEAEEKVVETSEIPITEIELLKFSEKFVLIYPDKEAEGIDHNIVLNISVGIHNTKETAKEVEELKVTFATKESIMRDSVETLLKTKYVDDFSEVEKIEQLKHEILEKLAGKLESDTLIDVYFNNLIVSSR